MLKLIDAEKKYLKEYKEAYINSIRKIEEGKMKNHNLMFINPDENDVIKH